MANNNYPLTNLNAKQVTINGADYTITKGGKVYGAYGQPIKIRPNTDGYASFTVEKKVTEQEELYISLWQNASYQIPIIYQR